MATKKRVTRVREHIRHVPASPKNPDGMTVVDEHLRKVPTTGRDDLKAILKHYKKKGIVYPGDDDLNSKNGRKYDDVIAIWTDYFNQKFPALPPGAPLDPNVVKALIGSESDFRLDPPGNTIAYGIAQITKQTLNILQDPAGEAKDYLFKQIRLKDLKDPEIAIALAVRWLFRKRATAANTMRNAPTVEELILEYKGFLKSKSPYKSRALEKFRKNYEKLRKK